MAKFELVFCLNKRNPFLSRNFLNSPLFERVTFFHVAITGNFERFSEKRKPFSQTGLLFFS